VRPDQSAQIDDDLLVHMTGPDHFAEGELYLALAKSRWSKGYDTAEERSALAVAAVHFAAAQAAVTAAAANLSTMTAASSPKDEEVDAYVVGYGTHGADDAVAELLKP
jgi:hypothetical protein